MTSKSATALVIFVVAIAAFCLASCFAAMTGPITIPFGFNSENTTDNVSVVPVDNSYDDSDYQGYSDYSESSYSSSNVETTTAPSDDSSSNGNPNGGSDSSGSTSEGGSQDSSNVETTTG